MVHRRRAQGHREGPDAYDDAVVECKRPDVEITAAVADQAMRYNAVLDVRWIFLTNGRTTLIFKREGDRFVPAKVVPDYEGMLVG